MGRRRGRTLVTERQPPLAAVTPPISPLVAERLCEVLEADGINATFIGRANAPALPPGAPGISELLGTVQVAVPAEEAERALRLLAEVGQIDSAADETETAYDPGASVYSSSYSTAADEARAAAFAAFGVEPKRRWWNPLRRR
jgi:hypothetical protein